jgi:urease accessory protein
MAPMPFEAALPEAAARPVTSGRAEIGFRRREGATRLTHLFQHEPLRVLFPAPLPDDVPGAVLVTTSGGLVGGDTLEIAVDLGPDAAAQVTAQAAEKVYRSAGPDARVTLGFRAGKGAWLEYLPPETILFDGARLRRRALVELQAGAAFLGGEILVFGRAARGERLMRGLVHDAWEICVDGRPVWADAFHLSGDLPRIWADPACLDGAEAAATLILAGAGAAALIDFARERLGETGVRSGASIVSGVLLARFLGRAVDVRNAWAALAAALRSRAGGLPPRLPRLWHV